jgi:GNAT superfamily N-acetyltransferase
MAVEIREVTADILPRYDRVPIAMRVESVLRVEELNGGLGGLRMVEQTLDEPYEKDYDAYEPEGAARWAELFDVSHWGFFVACDGDEPVGGAVVAFRSPGVDLLEGREDLAALWDLRVRPDRRREGIGTRLFRHAADWARRQGCTQLKAETQNVNVPACRFYARQGCHLGAIDRYAYTADERVAHETMLIWRLDL